MFLLVRMGRAGLEADNLPHAIVPMIDTRVAIQSVEILAVVCAGHLAFETTTAVLPNTRILRSQVSNLG